MSFMIALSNLILPSLLLFIFLHGILKKVPVFDVFLEGAKEGLLATFKIAPALVGLLTAIAVFKASGALDILVEILRSPLAMVGIPKEVLPLAILRPVSGSGSLAVVSRLLKEHGPDSFIGRCVSVIMGSTETTFYTIAVYFGAAGIKKIRYTAAAALCADFCGFFLGCLAVRLLFGE